MLPPGVSERGIARGVGHEMRRDAFAKLRVFLRPVGENGDDIGPRVAGIERRAWSCRPLTSAISSSSRASLSAQCL